VVTLGFAWGRGVDVGGQGGFSWLDDFSLLGELVTRIRDLDTYARFCTGCQQYRDLEDFHRDAHASSGYRSQCAACESEKRRTTDPTPVVPEGHKWCPGCEQALSVERFGADKRRKDGLRGRCRGCLREQKREWNRRRRSDSGYRERENARRRERRASRDQVGVEG